MIDTINTVDLTLEELFTERYRPLRLRGRSQNTVRLYGCTIRSFSKWLRKQARLSDLTDLTVSMFLDKRAIDCSPYTAEKERTQLLCLWRFACDLNLIQDRPMVPQAPLPDIVPKAWTVDEMKSLFRAARYTREPVGDIPGRVFWPALIAVLWETAERIGAIMNTVPSDLTPPFLLCRAEVRKGGKSARFYKLSEGTIELLKLCEGKDKIFPWPYSQNSMFRKFGDVVQRAGLGFGFGKNGARGMKFHQIRRSAASHYAANGGDATHLLDHSSPRITKKWYLDKRMVDNRMRPCEVLPKID
jgi:integrase